MIKETTLTKLISTWSISFTTIFALTSDMKDAIEILTIMICIDFVTGVIKSWIQKETSSEWMSRWLLRKMILVLVPLIIWLTWKWVWIDLSTFLTWSISALIVSEAYSIIANIYTIQTWKKAKEYDIMTIIIRKFWNLIETFLIDKK